MLNFQIDCTQKQSNAEKRRQAPETERTIYIEAKNEMTAMQLFYNNFKGYQIDAIYQIPDEQMDVIKNKL